MYGSRECVLEMITCVT
ncbi:hypothetical protein F383_37711 [Gossypium arboreum]|uniref:Uncharacterized protein n=1 Tax=Gossypium arboreum TaxID=29729 RepID=A0A0B0MGB2_GOSAR|nr:hypothetical protein F383_37711 [Gossypium arboreum]